MNDFSANNNFTAVHPWLIQSCFWNLLQAVFRSILLFAKDNTNVEYKQLDIIH